MSRIGKDEGDMAVVIERIIMTERSDSDAFIKYQNKRLHQLREIQKRKEEGKRIKRGIIISELKASGVLDESGKLAKPYSSEEWDE